MTDSPTSQAMHLAMTELKEREQRLAEQRDRVLSLEVALRLAVWGLENLMLDDSLSASRERLRIVDVTRSVLSKETSRGS